MAGCGCAGLNVHSKFSEVASVGTDSVQFVGSGDNSAFMGQAGNTLQFRARNTFQPYLMAEVVAVVAANRTVYFSTPLSGVTVGDLMEPVDPWRPTFLSVRLDA